MYFNDLFSFNEDLVTLMSLKDKMPLLLSATIQYGAVIVIVRELKSMSLLMFLILPTSLSE